MELDFEAALVAATLICGLIWLVDAYFFAGKRRRTQEEHGDPGGEIHDPALVEYARSFFPVLLIVLLLRSFVAEPFRIPSRSMLPTLEVGDFILVNKFAYGLRLPVTHWKILDVGHPERGDVMVFRYPRDPSVNYIKRVIGLPGDRITYYNRRLYVNDTPVPIERVGPYWPDSAGAAGLLIEYRETFGEDDHSIALDPSRRSIEGQYVVPEGEYFVMGDNRDHSNDGRRWGTVPEANLVGEAELIWMHWDWTGGGIGWSRIGNAIE